MAGVCGRARRAVLRPSVALVTLGAIVVANGVLVGLWPHDPAVNLGWIAALLAIRPLVRRSRRRSEERRGVVGGARLRTACAAAALAAVALAVIAGANPLITAVAVTAALAAYLAGRPAVALAVLAAGVVGDLVLLDGGSRAAGEILVGAALIAIGLTERALERER
jgi:hypothetical protein